ncbi:Mu transposase C-terminal domain-containing protein [Streptomyces sp. B6B3]|uniref:Mu transposase C-terminal domain-containing protein n=1 Tax=Streptomyces sp. B6B3 TaxID=3153570 RepID=UPI00325FD1C4
MEGLALRSLRGPAVRRLLALRERGPLSTGQVRLVAECLAVSERTVWRWLAAAEKNPTAAVEPGSRTRNTSRFTVTPEVRQLLALWGGNVTAVHRELTARARSDREGTHAPENDARDGHTESPSRPAAGGSVSGVPSLTTLRRAIRRDLTAGERAARKKDVFLARPARWRNACWEGDHVRAPVLVDVDGTACRPWITWFIDCATRAVMGVAVTPHTPSRDAVLAALRAAVLREDPYGPFGGLPEQVPIDRGKDFLAKTVTAALGALKATQDDLPAYTPHLKGTVESLNRSVERMHLVALPGYVRAPAPGKRPRKNPGRARLMDFATFTADLLGWVEWWNTEHRPVPLGGRTPLEAWQADPTPLDDLWALTLEDDGRVRKLTTRGIRWRGRDYAAAWMTGQAGRKIRVRWMPHHDHAIEVTTRPPAAIWAAPTSRTPPPGNRPPPCAAPAPPGPAA